MKVELMAIVIKMKDGKAYQVNASVDTIRKIADMLRDENGGVFDLGKEIKTIDIEGKEGEL
jgi:hypothetical protein